MTNCDPNKDYELLYSENNKDNSIELSIYYMAPFSFGQHGIKIYGNVNNENKELLIHDKISNDGSNIGKSNAQIVWKKDGAQIILNGKEQDAKTYQIFMINNKLSTKIINRTHQ